MLAPKITKERSTVPQGWLWQSTQPAPTILDYIAPSTVSVEMTMAFFDPPFDPRWIDTATLPPGPYQGHNLVPLPPNNWTDTSSEQPWYPISNSNRLGVPAWGGFGSPNIVGNIINPDPHPKYRLYNYADFAAAWSMTAEQNQTAQGAIGQ